MRTTHYGRRNPALGTCYEAKRLTNSGSRRELKCLVALRFLLPDVSDRIYDHKVGRFVALHEFSSIRRQLAAL